MQVFTDVSLDRQGRLDGSIFIPYSHNLGGWANLPVPIAVLANGDGPTVLLMAGNHGDEYPGQVALLKLWRELSADDVSGRLILIPCLNPPASKAGARLSPLDGRNLNRSFPGDPDGSVSEMLAHFLSTVLIPTADVVIDLHTGGRSVNFVPCPHMHLVSDPDQRRKMLEGAEAYNTEYAFLYADVAGKGLLPVEAERQGKTVITTEMGGGEPVLASVHRVCQSGLRNVLVHCGVLRGDFQTRESVGLGPTRWVQALDREDYRFAPESGLYENCVELGELVREGDLLGQVFNVERPDRAPTAVYAHKAGVLIANRGPSMVGQGDCVACVAHEVDPRELP